MLRSGWVVIACVWLMLAALPVWSAEPVPEAGGAPASPDAPPMVAPPAVERPLAPEVDAWAWLRVLGFEAPSALGGRAAPDARAERPAQKTPAETSPAPDPAPPAAPEERPEPAPAPEDETPTNETPPGNGTASLLSGIFEAVAPLVPLVKEGIEELEVPDLADLAPEPLAEESDEQAPPEPVAGAPAPMVARAAAVAPAPTVAPVVYVMAAATAVAAVGGAGLVSPALTPRALLSLARRALWIPLFSRLAKADLLDHGTRQRIVDAVEASPGAAISELAAVLDLKIGTVRHHLRALEASGIVVSVASGRRRCFFRAGACGSREARVQHAALSAPAARRVFALIQQAPGIRQRELARALGVSATSVIFHARRLEAVGVVRCAREGRTLAYYPGRLDA